MPWGIGILEYWNIGFGGRRSVSIGFYKVVVIQKIKSNTYPFLSAEFNIPYIHHSIIPWVICQPKSTLWGEVRPRRRALWAMILYFKEIMICLKLEF